MGRELLKIWACTLGIEGSRCALQEGGSSRCRWSSCPAFWRGRYMLEELHGTPSCAEQYPQSLSPQGGSASRNQDMQGTLCYGSVLVHHHHTPAQHPLVDRLWTCINWKAHQHAQHTAWKFRGRAQAAQAQDGLSSISLQDR
jgi:hypothetical protein